MMGRCYDEDLATQGPQGRAVSRHRPRRHDVCLLEGHRRRGLPLFPLTCLRQSAARTTCHAGAEGGEDRYRRFTVQPKTMTFGNIRNPFLREVGTGHALLPQSPDARRRAEQPELLDPPLHGSQCRPQGLRHGPQGQGLHTERGRTHRLLPRRAVSIFFPS